MKGLTKREEEIMNILWTNGPLFVKEMLAFFDEPKPHFNTVSTIVRGLEEKGFIGHKSFGPTYQYFAQISEEEYGKHSIKNVVGKYFNNSYLNVVSSLVEEEQISIEELKELIERVQKQ